MSLIEGLEDRKYFATLRVGSVVADNRGEVVIRFSEKATGVKGSAFQLYTAGSDGKLFTADDKRESVGYSYSENKKQLTIRGKLPKDTAYRIKLDGKTRIKSQATGELLDGNFNGTLASGDGKAGGNFEAQFSRDKSSTPTVRFTTNEGVIDIRLRGDVAPRNASNFLSYVNTARYDRTIFTRGINGFIVQGGALQIQNDGNQAADIEPTTQDPAIQDEARVLSNTRGTISIAKSGPNTVTNQFFFNLGNNSSNLDVTNPQNGTFFTPFAQILNEEGFTLLDKVASSTTVDFTGKIDNGGSGAGIDAVPVRSPTVTANNVKPVEDLFQVYRAAAVMVIAKK